VIHFDPQAYGPVFAPLLETDRRRPLGSGRPDSSGPKVLKELDTGSAFSHARSKVDRTQPVDTDMAGCCISGVCLLHDCLDESHTISQGIDTTSGSFWHAIMHRREGDFWNSKYWFRRVGPHPAFEAICRRVGELAGHRGQEQNVKKLTAGGSWDPSRFVDLCESSVSHSSDAHDLCLDIQLIEWEALFDHCYHAAIGK
jgi:hypothetical protein